MNLKVDIDKESRDVVISKASLFPEIIKCAGTSTLTATIKNLGKGLEDDAKLEIINSDLNINYVQKNIELGEDPFDDDNEFTKRVPINVDRDTKAGRYPIKIKSYIQEGILWETKTVYLKVEPCAVEVEEVEEEINETEIAEVIIETEEETTEGEEIPLLEPITTIEVPLTKRPLFWFTIIVLNIIVIVAIAFLVVKLVEKK
jgi:hypothetical protein